MANMDDLKAEIDALKQQLKDARDGLEAVKGNSQKLKTEKKEVDEKLKSLGMPYNKLKQLVATISDVEEAELLASGRHKEVYESRLAKFRDTIHNPVVTERDDWKSKYESLKTRHDEQITSQALRKAWEKAHGKADKFKYIEHQGQQIFNLEEDVLVPRNSEGKVVYGPKGQIPITPRQWAAEILRNEPDFKIASNTPAHPARGGHLKAGQSGVNPWAKDYQGQDKYSLRSHIKRDAPGKARELMRAAGYASHR